jgi:long-chain acyl-CoA synthetase
VAESVVISEDDKLVGLIYPDHETLRKEGIGEDGLAALLDTIRKDVNNRLPDYMAVTKFRVHPEEFVKTPKKSIKRYLYMKD